MLSVDATFVTMLLFTLVVAVLSGATFTRALKRGVIDTGFGEISRALRPRAFRCWVAAYGIAAALMSIMVVFFAALAVQRYL